MKKKFNLLTFHFLYQSSITEPDHDLSPRLILKLSGEIIFSKIFPNVVTFGVHNLLFIFLFLCVMFLNFTYNVPYFSPPNFPKSVFYLI